MVKNAIAVTITLLAILALLGLSVVSVLRGRGVTVTLTEAQIQAWLDEQFPQQKAYGGGALRLSLERPRVTLADGSDRVGLSLDAVATPTPFPGLRLRGAAAVSGRIDYEPAAGAFFFRDVRAESLDVEGLPGLSSEEVLTAVSALAAGSLQDRPVYRLRADRPDERDLRAYLDAVRIENGAVILTLKWR